MPQSSQRWPSYTATIERIVAHAADIRSLFLRLPDEVRFHFSPGQFISLSLPLAGQNVTRPYTLASSPDQPGPLEIVLNLVPGGLGSAYLFGRAVGEELTFTGPFGLFTLERRPDCEAIFVAERTAIAPIRPMIKRALTAPAGATMRLLYGAEHEAELIYQAEFRALATAHPEFQFAPLLPRQGESLSGFLLKEVRERYVEGDQRRDRQFYLCGVGSGVLEMRQLLRDNGYPRQQIHYEKW
jgi:ferredoxin-NADP reductase